LLLDFFSGTFQPTTDLQLKFYSYFKQATEGPNTKPKPSFWDIPGQVKWSSWKNLGSMTKEEAMAAYIEELKTVNMLNRRTSHRI